MEKKKVGATRVLLLYCAIATYFASAFLLPEYWRYLLLIMSIMVIVTQGLNVMIGFAGIFSFGQPGFMAFGAYMGAILSERFPWIPFPLILLAAGSASAFLGLVIGFPCLRLQGFYLAMATFGFSSSIYQLINYLKPLTGGNEGMYAPAPAIGSLKFGSTTSVLLIAAVCVVLVQYAVRRLDRSRTGRAFKALRDDEIAASSMGIDLAREKLKAFAFGAFLAGVAGVLYSYAIKYLEVGYFSNMGLSFFLILVVGGIGRVYGPLFGSVFLTLLPQLLGGKFSQQMSLVYGMILVAFVLAAPEGFYGLWRRIRRIGAPRTRRRGAA
ncbi:MAG: branched-chain amino acid ABC transporter permease [Spirochaetales bacterium]